MYPKSLLFALDPEQAHNVVRGSLKVLQAAGLAPWLRASNPVPDKPVEVAGLKFRNPVGLAAGFDKNAEMIPALAALGFGFIEAGTLTRRPQHGNPKPRLFRHPEREAIVNRMGFNNVGVEAAARALEKTEHPGVPLGLNIGKAAATALEDSPKEYAECAAILRPVSDYLVLNISSPNTADLRRLHEPDRLKALLDAVLSAVAAGESKPVFLKVSPDATDQELSGVAALAVSYKVGLIATNTTLDRAGLTSLEAGGLSGKPLKARADAVLKRLKQETQGRVPLIGVGGILSAADARDKFEAGADLVQVYTGLVYRGPGLVREIVAGLAS